MKILVMGSGAVGGYYGAVLAKAGHDVLFIARGDHAAAMESHGLIINSVTSNNFILQNVFVKQELDGLFEADLVLYCVKGYSNVEAIKIIEPAVVDNTHILTLQNGLGSGDQLEHAFDKASILLGATYIDASLESPGVINEYGGGCSIVFGPKFGKPTHQIIDINETMVKAGINSNISEDINSTLWSKLILICALSGMMCVTRESIKQILTTKDSFNMIKGVISEVANVARSMKVYLPDTIEEEQMSYLLEHKEVAVSSMFMDLINGNPLEVDVLNGAVSKLGKQNNIDTPLNDFICLVLQPYNDRAKVARALGQKASSYGC
ncbi:MAG: 2-dehydropantoate 2-reductase [SAR202 cluster bacterium]|nr:2-dehydropantoate 2-reductase [SAR202 cluster bacterium]